MRHVIETQDADARLLQEEAEMMSIPSIEYQGTLSEEDEQFLLHHEGDATVCNKDGTISITHRWYKVLLLLLKGGDLCKGELDTCEEYKCFPGSYQGTCVKGNVAAETPCDDGDPTTENDTCDASGVCAGTCTECDSDIRLKKDIHRLGESPSGIPVYSFKYREDMKDVLQNEDTTSVYFGAMAQDLLELAPEAVRVGPNGYYSVDYSKIDVDFIKLV